MAAAQYTNRRNSQPAGSEVDFLAFHRRAATSIRRCPAQRGTEERAIRPIRALAKGTGAVGRRPVAIIEARLADAIADETGAQLFSRGAIARHGNRLGGHHCLRHRNVLRCCPCRHTEARRHPRIRRPRRARQLRLPRQHILRLPASDRTALLDASQIRRPQLSADRRRFGGIVERLARPAHLQLSSCGPTSCFTTARR